VDEVRRAEDSMRLIGHDAERLRPLDVLPLGDGRRRVAGAGRLIDAVAPPGWKREKEKEKEKKNIIRT